MLKIDNTLTPAALLPKLNRVFDLAATKIAAINGNDDGETPVFTVGGKYTSRGWTEWTQGFQYGCAILQYDATREARFLEIGRTNTVGKMASHVSHIGVHDHGFNNVSTYGNLLRLMNEGVLDENVWERNFYELALKITGAVQASRWTALPDGFGFIHSFNGSHSLFSDTIRSCRALVVSHQLGHALMDEQDVKVNLLQRSIQHAETTAKYNVYYGSGRDAWDISGRVVHESIFNVKNGCYRCPSSQQGYSPFTTWTRGHAWVLCGFPEQLEFLDRYAGAMPEVPVASERWHALSKERLMENYLNVATTVADFYLERTPTDGIPYWDDGAPGLVNLGDWMNKAADPFNDHEPVDSSAAAIAAQGLIRLGTFLKKRGGADAGSRYLQAGLTVAARLFEEPYLSVDPTHQGLLLHSVYHQPNGWDNVPDGRKVPCGESSMWGDYHAMELALLLKRMADDQPRYTFFG